MNINNVVFERSFGTSSQLPASTLPEIAFAGRSNVGKSSLLNKLFNRKGLAKVSQTPGKTATINFFACDGVRFVDLPGYGYAKVSKSEKERWSELKIATWRSWCRSWTSGTRRRRSTRGWWAFCARSVCLSPWPLRKRTS